MEEVDEKRSADVKEIKSSLTIINEELSAIFHGLQWDRKLLLERAEMVTCTHNKNHRIPISSREAHERQCNLTKHGYSREDLMLPGPSDSATAIKFSKQQIRDMIFKAAQMDPQFRRGIPTEDELEPLTVERLQATYTTDERRAIYDAVVSAAPSSDYDLSDLPLPNSGSGSGERVKSREQVLAELRDMKRRRTKYRVASHSVNYSHTIRDLISTQMELYTGANKEMSQTITNPTTSIIKQEPADNIEKDTSEKNTLIKEAYYDRSIDRNILYGRDRSRSRSQERRNFSQGRRFEDRRRLDNQRKVYSRSPSKTHNLKQEDRKRSSSRRIKERSFDKVQGYRNISNERSHDKDNRQKEEGSARNFKESGSKDRYSSRSERNYNSKDDSTRRRDNSRKTEYRRSRSRDKNRKKYESSSSSHDRDNEYKLKRYYDA